MFLDGNYRKFKFLKILCSLYNISTEQFILINVLYFNYYKFWDLWGIVRSFILKIEISRFYFILFYLFIKICLLFYKIMFFIIYFIYLVFKWYLLVMIIHNRYDYYYFASNYSSDYISNSINTIYRSVLHDRNFSSHYI